MAIPNPNYQDPSAYAKYLDGKHKESCHNEGCCDSKPCNTCCGEFRIGASCPCPAGLVKVEDADDNCIGCLTPSDAEIYNNTQTKCPDGFVKLYDATTSQFLGCVTVADAKTYKAV